MERTPVVSSVIQSIGYDAESSTLEIQFFNDAIYEYSDVPEKVYMALMSAKSHGNYFDVHIKNACYGCRRVAEKAFLRLVGSVLRLDLMFDPLHKIRVDSDNKR
jgi:hypothetical protein